MENIEQKIQEEKFNPVRVKTIIEEIEKIYESIKEQLFNFLNHKNLNMEENKTEILELDDYRELFNCFSLLQLYREIEILKNNVSEEHKAVAFLVNHFYFEQKLDLRRIINMMQREKEKIASENEIFAHNYKLVSDNFYKRLITEINSTTKTDPNP